MSEVKIIRGKDKNNLEIALKELNTKKVGKSGWFSSAKYDNGVSVAMIASQNEFGNPDKNIPPRPFMRIAVTKSKNELRLIANDQAKQIISGKSTATQALEIISGRMAGAIRDSIAALVNPTLKDKTIKARLYRRKDKLTVGNLYKPLVDTGIMLNYVTHRVENE